ncbi:hypothetical protein M949_2180 [Riemerella anatipestifer CH3]|nr:hypothetical protein M949_2180 [Riemerella anatipestifer CH3]
MIFRLLASYLSFVKNRQRKVFNLKIKKDFFLFLYLIISVLFNL